MAVKSKITLKKLFENKKFATLFSVLAAIMLWFVITVTESPDSENIIGGLTVSIPIENTVVSEMGMDIINDTSNYTASVTVKGPAYVVSGLSTEDILVTASVANVTTAGTYSLDLRATKQSAANSDFEIVSISPKSINVTFDQIDTVPFVVNVQATGYKAVDGLVAEQPFVSDSNNATLNFKGSLTNVKKIAKVVAITEVNKTLSKTETFEGELKVYDADNKELPIENYTITTADGLSAPEINITVPIYKEKTVPIKAQFINVPDAYKNKAITHTLEHRNILISGPPETIDTITSIQLSEIDFDQIADNDQKFETTLILPEGVKNKDNIETVMVEITGLTNYITRTFTVSKISVVSKDGNATLSRNIRNVKVFGPRSVINKLSSGDFYAEVDVSGLQSGEHSVAARIKCKDANNVWQVGTYTASVNVK